MRREIADSRAENAALLSDLREADAKVDLINAISSKLLIAGRSRSPRTLVQATTAERGRTPTDPAAFAVGPATLSGDKSRVGQVSKPKGASTDEHVRSGGRLGLGAEAPASIRAEATVGQGAQE